MTRRQLLSGATILLLLSAIIFMPLRTIVGGNGLSARSVDGIIWDGSIRDLRLGKLPIGDVNARLHFLPLFLGRGEISFSRGEAPFAPGISGSISKGLGGVEISNLKATFSVNSIFAPLPAETMEFQDFSARYVAGRCAEASGSVRLNLGNALPGLDLSNGLLGKPRCDKGQLILPFLSQSAMERVDIRLSNNGDYTAMIHLEGDRSEMSASLGMAGFRPVAGGYRMVRRGRL